MPPAAAVNNGAGARQRRAVNLQQLQQQSQQQPQQSSKPWFSGSPITKIICILWVAGSLWVIRNNGDDDNTYSNRNNSNDNYSNGLWVSALWNGPSNWFFSSSTELIVGLSFLVHYLRRLEQELSSRRFIAWLFTLEIVYIFIRLVAVLTFDEDVTGTFVGGGGTTAAKGPYLFVGAVLYWYKTYVPRLYPRFLSSSTLGISCSEKTFPYLCAIYILFMRGTASLLAGSIGMVASGIFFFLLSLSTNNNNSSSNIPFIDVPDMIVNMLPWESMGSLFFLDPNPKVFAPYFTRGAINIRPGGGGGPRRNRGQEQQGAATRRVPMAGPAQPSAAAAMPPPPPPEAIAQLISMGFDEQRVKEALQVSDNNVETAANLLLMGS
ncbi:hypothetical protein FRACYDRAFT_237687 [Fragilariopsis cylindrus CCMP1102]|uniref:UBA domain-containing protein n=1 Tax=Fragilariopsis cylindrus CCMP1102 TaxID=635003 RepID=A0A1E7FGH9_9STRA|nr:hypothetical protein FRACYDRAFT_237687 [Fragilariopsis cylindrus CCMP1102]|eukprot:OEU17279.1 hypothetical protein FRACYDRAFT_237687 [Fragilariopsis cylindrus CCMP1102]